MTAGNWFWIVFIILALFGGYMGWSYGDRRVGGAGLVVLVLVGLLGWATFGPPLK